MASPGVFLSSSPLRKARQHIVPSSSPDLLPSIQDLLPQNAGRPATKSGGKAIPATDTATCVSWGARDLWRSAQAAKVSQTSPSRDSNQLIVIDDRDPATNFVDAASHHKTSSRRRRPLNVTPEASRQPSQQTQTEGALETTYQPWKKFKPQTPEKDVVGGFQKSKSVCLNSTSAVAGTALADDTIRACSQTQDSLAPAQPPAGMWDPKDSLQLEPAMMRRKEWTPPPEQRAKCAVDPESAADMDAVELDDDKKTESFEALLTAYKCGDGAIDEAASSQSDGSASKRRKLTSCRPVKAAPAPAPAMAVVNTVTKKKTSRKKPRTITALATAAYKQVTQGDESANAAQDDASHAPLLHQRQAVQSKEKSKARKRTARPKKKIQPPKPILLSPETALKQVAQQDFVFGTSSQLAGEQSPTFLRDLQRAMKTSNQLDMVEFCTPLNSDAMEPPECRPKLWDAAARDVDGDLFDVEVINLAEDDACPPRLPGDPFGYFKGDTSVSPKLAGLGQAPDAPQYDDGFVNLSDRLPGNSEAPLPAPEMPRVGLSPPAGPCSPERLGEPHLAVCDVRDQHAETENAQPRSSVQVSALPASPPGAGHDARPAFEEYTDAQLSKEVSRYGFKPIKRRSAMITLLRRCWQQNTGHTAHQVRMKSTVAAASTSTSAPSPAKRPRGRPRKNSTNECEAQEPPPSAQVPETPKRARGRPGKEAETRASMARRVPKRRPSPSAPKPAVKVQGKTRAQKAKGAEPAEMADSESNLDDTLGPSPSSSSRCSSPRWSPRQDVDLTASLGTDAQLSLAMTSAVAAEAEGNVLDYITRAVTTAPRTSVATAPSWHEKILLYDPIVLEDFTAWLNSGQLTRVGYDEETNPVEVRRWCESKSVCCLWKVNLRGKERKRF